MRRRITRHWSLVTFPFSFLLFTSYFLFRRFQLGALAEHLRVAAAVSAALRIRDCREVIGAENLVTADITRIKFAGMPRRTSGPVADFRLS